MFRFDFAIKHEKAMFSLMYEHAFEQNFKLLSVLEQV